MKGRLKNCLIASAAIVAIACCTAPAAVAADSERAESEFKKYIAQGKEEGAYWPTQGWRTAAPEQVGMNSAGIVNAIEYAASPQYRTEGLLIVKNGYIVAEAYFGAFRKGTKHVSHSVAKSFTSALVGIAIDKGLVAGVNERLCEYYDQWDCDDADDIRGKMTIRNSLTLTSGLKWEEDWVNVNPATNDAIKMSVSGRFLDYILSREGLHAPGEVFTYSTGDPMLMSGVISKATGMNAFEFAKKNLFQPLGISSVRWGQDSQGYTATFSMLYLAVRDYAKFGYLFLNKGRWEDKQIVSEEWVSTSTRTDPSVKMWDGYGYLWHVNLALRYEGSKVPADAFMAAGVLGQNIVIIPSRDLVVVKVANEQGRGPDLGKLLTLVIEAIDDEAKS